MNQISRALMRKIQAKESAVGVVGLGYVGLPLVKAFLKIGFAVTGFDLTRDSWSIPDATFLIKSGMRKGVRDEEEVHGSADRFRPPAS